jgi:hypothetical protein
MEICDSLKFQIFIEKEHSATAPNALAIGEKLSS